MRKPNQCPKCGYDGPFKKQENRKVWCGNCSAFWFLPKPENENRRRDNNPTWAMMWREKFGELFCFMCGVIESNTTGHFEIDHIRPLVFGGADKFENTQPLCIDCHNIKHALYSHRRHTSGITDREAA